MSFLVNYDKPLIEGQLGTIYETIEGQKKICAKVINSNIHVELKENIKKYLNSIKHANHENLVKIYDVQYPNNEEVELIIYMDYYENGNLQTYLQNPNLTLENAIQLMKQILQGLQFLQNQKVQIDNIKLNNLILDEDGNIKLSDLWLNQVERNYDTQQQDQVYLSPQILTDSTCTDKKNVYAIGIIFYYIAYKRFPYEKNNHRKFFNDNKQNLFQCPDIQLTGDHNKKEELKILIESMLKFEEANRSDWNQIYSSPLFQFQSFQAVFNTFVDQDDQQLFKITRLDSIIIQEVLQNTNSIQLIDQQLSQGLLDKNQQETNQKKINIISVSSIQSNNSNKSSSKKSAIRLIPKQQIQDSMLISNQRNEKQVHYSNQVLSKADRVAKIIQIDLAKQKVVEQGIQLLRKNKLPIRDLYIYALIVALNGYKSNLLVNSIGFAYNSPQNINYKILEEFQKDFISSAIQEFIQSTNQSHIDLKMQLQEMSYESTSQYSEDFRLFSTCLDLDNDRLDALHQLAAPKQSRGMYTPYQKFMEQIKFIYEQYIKEGLNYQKYQEKNKIIIINSEIKTLAILKYICNLEQNYNFKNYYEINPDEIKIDESQYMNML